MIEIVMWRNVDRSKISLIKERSIQNGYKVRVYQNNCVELSKNVGHNEYPSIAKKARQTGWKVRAYQFNFRTIANPKNIVIFAE